MRQISGNISILGGLCAALLFTIMSLPISASAAPVALIIDIVAAKDSAVEPFSEVEAGTQIDLGKEGRLEFLDYSSCKTIIVLGGVLSFTEQRFSLRGGKITKEARGRCPKVVALDKNARVGGVLLRSGGATLRLNDRPNFAFTGGNVDRIRILADGTEVLSVQLQQPRFQWPSGAEGLAVGDYTIELQSKGGTTLKQLPFQVSKRGGKSPLTIIRLK